MSKPSVCFVAPKGLAALTGADARGQIGGAEAQQARLARGLQARGYAVSFVTLDYGQGARSDADGISVFAAYRPNAGLPGLRFVYPRWTGLWSAMRRAAADVYYERGAGSITGQAALFCRMNKRPFIFGVGSNSDCRSDLSYLKTWREKALYRYGLRNAHQTIAQTQWQVDALKSNFGVDATVVRSLAPQTRASSPRNAARKPPTLLWVGRLAYEKRPEWFIEMAARKPQWRFEIVGAENASTAYSQSVTQQAASCPNLRLLGARPFSEMARHYEAADFLVCTSHWEGFPNTFLEAWSAGVPVLTTFDPDGLVASRRLGVVGQNPDELVAAAESLVADDEAYAELSRRGLAHLTQCHDADAVMDSFESALFHACGGASAARMAGGA